MERLTNSNEEIKTLQVENEEYWLKVYFKLKEYEDAEEQGLLLKLPCKVGDKIYKLWPCGKNGKTVAEFEIAHIDVDFLPEIEFYFCKHKGSGSYYFSKVSEIGKTVFLTRKEAEAALAEMNNMEV